MIVILKQNDSKDNIQTEGFKNILNNNNATLIDGSMLPDMAKVEVANHNINQLKSHLGDGWDVFPEQKYTVPSTKRKVKD